MLTLTGGALQERNPELGRFTIEISLLLSKGDHLIPQGFSQQTQLEKQCAAGTCRDALDPRGLPFPTMPQSESQVKVQLYHPPSVHDVRFCLYTAMELTAPLQKVSTLKKSLCHTSRVCNNCISKYLLYQLRSKCRA